MSTKKLVVGDRVKIYGAAYDGRKCAVDTGTVTRLLEDSWVRLKSSGDYYCFHEKQLRWLYLTKPRRKGKK